MALHRLRFNNTRNTWTECTDIRLKHLAKPPVSAELLCGHLIPISPLKKCANMTSPSKSRLYAGLVPIRTHQGVVKTIRFPAGTNICCDGGFLSFAGQRLQIPINTHEKSAMQINLLTRKKWVYRNQSRINHTTYISYDTFHVLMVGAHAKQRTKRNICPYTIYTGTRLWPRRLVWDIRQWVQFWLQNEQCWKWSKSISTICVNDRMDKIMQSGTASPSRDPSLPTKPR